MNRESGIMGNSGFTLIEMLVVIGIIGILAIALGFSFEGWQGRYRVESTIKDVESDLMKARARAMQRNRGHFFTLAANQYTMQEDLSPWPDGDGDLTAADDVRPAGYNDPIPLLQKDVDAPYTLTWNGNAEIEFTTRGLYVVEPPPNDTKTICMFTDFDGDLDSDVEPDYDCLVISQTRIILGKLRRQDTAGGLCSVATGSLVGNGGDCEPK
jgi:prepilin-type N-terminal cleavage/methylation domain-containing protein